MKKNVYLVWLEWPEKCFRAQAKDIASLKAMVAAGSRVIWAKSEAAFLKALPSATHAIVWNFDAAWFARAGKLRVLATPAAGQELLPKAAPKGVTIHFGGFHGEAIAETVVGLMLAWCRGVVAAERSPKVWPRADLSSTSYRLSGTHAVILGYGRIGRAIGAKLTALGVRVTGIRRKNFGELTTVARTADWLVAALPGDTGTDNLINARLIAKLPRRCVIVNVGRGNVIDENALVKALVSRRIAGALLDVFKDEPLTPTRQIAGDVPNLVRLPHASAFYPEYVRDCFAELEREGLLK